MSVKLLDNKAFFGYRVRRTIGGKLYQEYFSLKRNGKRLGKKFHKSVELKARARDEQLAKMQLRSKQKLKAKRCFNADGSVRGISYLLKTEKSGAVTPIFQVGIASELKSKVVCTSYSLNAHGKKQAWYKAIDTYTKHKLIRKNTKLYKDLLKAVPKISA